MIRTLFFFGIALAFSILAAATAHHLFSPVVTAVTRAASGL